MRLDLQFAWRRIARQPRHAALVALTLGLGLGASFAMFGAIDAILLRPLPFREPDRLILVTQTMPIEGLPELAFSDVGYRRVLTDSKTLEDAAAQTARDANLIRGGSTDRIVVSRVTGNFLRLAGITPAIGRAFSAEEDTPNGPRALLLTDRLWRSHFGSDSGVVGTTVNLEGVTTTIVGVLPPEVVYPSRDVGAWEPMQLDPAATTPFTRSFRVIGRLKPGIDLATAQQDLTAAVRSVGRDFPSPHPGTPVDPANYSAKVGPLAASVVGDTRRMALLLTAGVGALLLLTCANVANLRLAESLSRSTEYAVRLALGASRAQLVRGALIEGVLLATLGAAVGAAIAMMGAGVVRALLPTGVPLTATAFGGRAVLAAVACILGVGAAVGAIPVVALTRRAAGEGLRHGATGAVPVAAGRLRKALAAGQVALAVLLLHDASLLLSSAREVGRVSQGFRAEGALAMRISLPAATQRDREARESLLRRLVGGIAAIPGVSSIGIANSLPTMNGPRDQAMAIEGRPFKADGTDPMADFRIVSNGYFAAMGIPLVEGRVFTDDEATDRSTPLVVNRALARQLMPNGESVVGRRLKFGPVSAWMPIVGVVGDAKNRSLAEPPRPEFYTPALGTWSQMSLRTQVMLVARTEVEPTALAPAMRELVRSSAPDVAVVDLSPLPDVVRRSRTRVDAVTRLMGVYAATALLLAIAGTYALLSFLVAQRRREIGLRIALGASPTAVVSLVLREAAQVAGSGALLGLLGAAATGRLLAGMLYGVTTMEPRILLGVVGGALVSAALASFVPAQQALRADPAATLRAGP